MAIRRLAVCLLGLLAAGASASAPESVAEFYKGKQIRMIVPSGTGGGFDLYARYVARYIGKHIPGNPTVIVQNMPGAGGLTAANFLHLRAPKDGLVIGTLQGPVTYAQVGKSPNVQFDMRTFGWLGSANVTSNTCVFTRRAGITSASDLLAKTVVIGV